MGDNPVPIIRDPAHYQIRPHHEDGTRAAHLSKHLSDLVRQSAHKDFRPAITNDWKTILRFAGNACFITEWEEVIEFRAVYRNDKRLYKYLLQDEILIVVDDLWFLGASPSTSLAELVTIFPKRIAADKLMKELHEREYIPNCIDLEELALFCTQIEQEIAV